MVDNRLSWILFACGMLQLSNCSHGIHWFKNRETQLPMEAKDQLLAKAGLKLPLMLRLSINVLFCEELSKLRMECASWLRRSNADFSGDQLVLSHFKNLCEFEWMRMSRFWNIFHCILRAALHSKMIGLIMQESFGWWEQWRIAWTVSIESAGVCTLRFKIWCEPLKSYLAPFYEWRHEPVQFFKNRLSR